MNATQPASERCGQMTSSPSIFYEVVTLVDGGFFVASIDTSTFVDGKGTAKAETGVLESRFEAEQAAVVFRATLGDAP